MFRNMELELGDLELSCAELERELVTLHTIKRHNVFREENPGSLKIDRRLLLSSSCSLDSRRRARSFCFRHSESLFELLSSSAIEHGRQVGHECHQSDTALDSIPGLKG